MFRDRLRLTLMLLLLAAAMPMTALADSPAADFKLNADATVFTSPDKTIRLEQYAKDRGDDGPLYQFWTFDTDHQHPFLLNPGEGDDLAGYAAGFRFTSDSQWLVRMQKLGAGTSTLFLYHRKGDQFLAATKKPLGDLAWDYFFALPASRKMSHREPRERDSIDHPQVDLVKGTEENYAWLGEHWPDSRYIVVSLSFDTQGEKPPTQWVQGWRCVYDLKTGMFSVPPDFTQHNAEAVKRQQ
jgi:hypothetical protein